MTTSTTGQTMNNYSNFIDYLLNKLSLMEDTINWEQALNPDDHLEAYQQAARWLIDPPEVPSQYEEGFNMYITLIENDMEAWAQNIRTLTESEHWYKLAKLLIEYGY